MCSSWDYLIFPGSWAKVGLVISLLAIAKGCQHDGKAVTPCGPGMQQQMDPQHHGRGNIWGDVCWGLDDGSWVRAIILLRAWASLQLKKGGLKSLWSPLGTLHWNQCPAHRAPPPALLCCVLGYPYPPCTTRFPDHEELGNFSCSPLCEAWLAWKGGIGKICAVFLACFHVL